MAMEPLNCRFSAALVDVGDGGSPLFPPVLYVRV